MLKAAIFDVGGVLTHSPVAAIAELFRAHGIPDETRLAIFQTGNGPWSRFERSEVSPAEFAAAFGERVRAVGGRLTGAEFLRWFSAGFGYRPEMIAVVRHLRGRVKLGAITNNVAWEEPPQRHTAGVAMHELFDVVVESALVGVRKPEPRIYQIACERLGILPREAVFLDDMGVNLKGARALGMTTIRVDHTLRAVEELEAALGIPLPRP